MRSIQYFDTTPYAWSPFAPHEAIDDYDAWLLQKYREHIVPGQVPTYTGVAQAINQVIWAKRHTDARIILLGPHAADAAVVIEYLTGFTVEIEVYGQ